MMSMCRALKGCKFGAAEHLLLLDPVLIFVIFYTDAILLWPENSANKSAWIWDKTILGKKSALNFKVENKPRSDIVHSPLTDKSSTSSAKNYVGLKTLQCCPLSLFIEELPMFRLLLMSQSWQVLRVVLWRCFLNTFVSVFLLVMLVISMICTFRSLCW